MVKGLENNIQGKAELYALVRSEEGKTKGRACGSLQLPKRRLQKSTAELFSDCQHKEGTEISIPTMTLWDIFSFKQISTTS